MTLLYKSKTHHAIYFFALVSGGFSVYFSLYYSVPSFLIVGLLVLTLAGWVHFLKLAVTAPNLSVDKKLVWFIALVSFFVFSAPLFLLLVLNKENKRRELKNE